jgi:hypothetical protein
VLGPPFTLTDEDRTTLVERTVDAIGSVPDPGPDAG